MTVYQGRQLTFSDADIIAIHEHDSRVSYEYPFNVNYTYTGSEPDLISSVDDTITWQLHTKPGVSANHAWSLFGDLTAEHTDSFGGISGLIAASARGPGDLSISAIASSTVPFVELSLIHI